MSRHPFEMVALPQARSAQKPRRTGITMMMDWGIPLGRLDDLLGLIGPYVDLGKLVVGTSRLYEEDYYRAKLDLYHKYEIKPFIGGQFLEYVFATQGWSGVEPYCAEAKRFGIEAIEVSDNCVPLSDEERARMIRTAIDCGLEVHGEVGSKDAKQTAADLVEQAKICFDSGCEVVLVEAAELLENGAPQRNLIDALRKGLDASKVLFELPGPWIKGTTLTDIYELKKFFIKEFGPDVNLANVLPDDVFELEALRVGLSVVGPARVAKAAE